MLAANGAVLPVGGASWFGDPTDLEGQGCEFVSISAAPGGRGYILVTSTGGIYTYGTGRYLGSPLNLAAGSIDGFAANATETGYWELGKHGPTYPFGSVPTLCPFETTKNLVAMAVTPDDQGIWITTAAGGIYSCGTAAYYGSPMGQTTSSIVAMAATLPNQPQGYYLLEKSGTVFAYGYTHTYPLN